ncbi:MAG: hypothetical protein FD189_2146 [Elusimicrobia bacterium]|nr:MAG: hypothetical protein FD154_2160 [Elusimicrobiota bacterium]KAF0153975.1 MAG: hypothetical protein FD189_2146 [Elusimicrobiota bacterium]
MSGLNMGKKDKAAGTVPEKMSFKVSSLAAVDRKMLAGIKRPADIKTLTFYPRRQVDGLYALLQKNIPKNYEARLGYIAKKEDIKVPGAFSHCSSLKIEPLKSVKELLSAYTATSRPLVRAHFPKGEWAKRLAEGRKFYTGLPPGMAFRAVKGRSVAGFMLLKDLEYRDNPVKLIGWVWIRKTLTVRERRRVQRLMLAWLKRKTATFAVAAVDAFNPASQGFFRKAGFKVDRLNLSLPRTTLVNTPGIMPQSEWLEGYKKIWKAVGDAEYGRAMSLLTPLYRKYPRDFKVTKTYAMVLGDYAESLGGARGKALKARSRAMLRGLLRKLGNVRWEWNISARNEYYYHTGQFRKQYFLGREAAAGGHNWGYYGQGVGAANYAYAHAGAGRRGLAGLWALRAVEAWEKFFKYKADYYNAYVHYALALGILGRAGEMEAALKKSARLSGKPVSCREFAEVRAKISGLG